MSTKRSLIQALAISLFFSAVSLGATIHVPADQPTIQGGIDAAVNGDTVLVADGTYLENINFHGKSIVLTSENGRDYTFIEPYVASNSIVTFDSHEDANTVLHGFTIRNTYGAWGIYCQSASPTIQYNNICYCIGSGIDGAGIWWDSSSVKIKYNNIYENHNGNTGGGIGGQGTGTVEIAYNVIYNNSAGNGPGIGLISPALGQCKIHHNIIYNNTSDGYVGAGIYINGQNSKIYNNTIHNNSQGIHILGGTGMQIYNNIIVNNQYDGLTPGSADFDYNDVWNNGLANTPGINGISQDPMFSNVSTNDLSLSPESPCIDAGNPDPEYNDPDGTRNDIGALPIGGIPNGKIIYVATDGSDDTGDGTQGNPFMTIQYAIDVAISGDTILVDDGIYEEHLNINIPISLLSKNGADYTTITGNYPGFNIINILSGSTSYVTISGFLVTGAIGKSGIYASDNSKPIIISNIIVDNDAFGIEIQNCSDLLISDNTVYNSQYGIYIRQSSIINISNNRIRDLDEGPGIDISGCNNVVVRRNTITRNDGILFSHGGDVVFENNIVYKCDFGIYNIIVDNINIVNNTIDSCINGINLYGSNYVNIRNNISVNNDYGYGIKVEDVTEIDMDFNNVFNNFSGNYFGVLPGEGNISEDPQFSGIPGNEYYLLGSSPCIDAGDPADPVPDGGGDRIDMGALEYTGLILDFSLLTPADSTVLFTYSPTFEWEELPSGTEYGQLSYSLFIDDAENFGSSLEYDAGISAMYAIPDPLTNYGFWYWKVKAYNDTAAFWSNEVFTFRIDYTPHIPQLISPIGGEAADASSWLIWTESYDADADDTVTYTLEIDNNLDFLSPEVTEVGISSEPGQKDGAVTIRIQNLQDFANLQDNTAYYWRVKAVDRFAGESGFPDGTASFHYNPQTPEPTAPGMPTIVSPANGEGAIPETWLTWEESVDPDINDTVSYTIEIDDNNDFSSPEVTQSGITDTPGKSLAGVQINTLTDYNNLQDDITYFWRTKAVDKYALESAFTDGTAYFMYNSVNSLPNPPTAGFSPSNDFTTNNLLPTISWYPGTDPDPSDNSAALHYELWIDDDSEFDTSVQFIYMTAPGTPLVILTDSLTDETHWDYIVRTIDDQDLESNWSAMQSFWTNSKNDTPMVFQANYPDAQIIYEMKPEFAWGTSVETDPLDSVYYKFYLAVDPNFQFVNVIDSIWDTTFIRLDSLAFAEEYWWKVKAVDNTNLPRFSSNVASFRTWKLGDVNTNWTVDILDIVYLVNYKFKGGPAPTPMISGDMDGNCTINILDIVYLVNYKFKTGPEPEVGCE